MTYYDSHRCNFPLELTCYMLVQLIKIRQKAFFFCYLIMFSISLSVAMTSDETENKARQQEETGQNAGPPSSEEALLQPCNRNSGGRGLSRLFSFLKRRSQCESEAGEKEDEEEEAKAPIAEPELRTEGEVALDQHSVSSAEAQVSLHATNVATIHLQIKSFSDMQCVKL